jgi:5-formyltetrahydrofolate cyclo-ligase
MNKAEARKYIKEQKQLLSAEEKSSAAEAAFATLEREDSFVMSSNVLMFYSLPDEISTHTFIEKWCDYKHIYLPRVNGCNLDILKYRKDGLRHGSFNIEEPEGTELCDIANIDLIVVPGVAFDRNCNRVGRGKGYYDRLLATNHATTIGIAYDFQVLDDIEVEPHDVPLDILITDKHIYKSIPLPKLKD